METNRSIGGLLVFLVGLIDLYMINSSYRYLIDFIEPLERDPYYLPRFYIQLFIISMVIIGGYLLLGNQRAGGILALIGSAILLIWGFIDVLVYSLRYPEYTTSGMIFHQLVSYLILSGLILFGSYISSRREER